MGFPRICFFLHRSLRSNSTTNTAAAEGLSRGALLPDGKDIRRGQLRLCDDGRLGPRFVGCGLGQAQKPERRRADRVGPAVLMSARAAGGCRGSWQGTAQ